MAPVSSTSSGPLVLVVGDDQNTRTLTRARYTRGVDSKLASAAASLS